VSGTREHEWRVINYFQAFWMQWMALAVVIAIVLLGSIVFAAPSSNATISLVVVVGIIMVGGHLNRVATSQPEPWRTIFSMVYFTIPHLEWFDLRDFVIYHAGVGTVAWKYCALASVYAAVYTAFLLFTTWVLFRRKALNT
jgi:hypothetical protein